MGKNELKLSSVSATMPVKCATRGKIIGWLRDAAEIAAQMAQRNDWDGVADGIVEMRQALDSTAWTEYLEIADDGEKFTISAKTGSANAVLLALSMLFEIITKEAGK